jgi:hypothetical protein
VRAKTNSDAPFHPGAAPASAWGAVGMATATRHRRPPPVIHETGLVFVVPVVVALEWVHKIARGRCERPRCVACKKGPTLDERMVGRRIKETAPGYDNCGVQC